MSEGTDFFAGLDLESVDEDPTRIPANTYDCLVTQIVVKESKNGKVGLNIYYTVQDGDYSGSDIFEWKAVVSPADPSNPTMDEKKSMWYIRRRLLDFGVEADRLTETLRNGLDSLVGTHVYVTVKHNGDYTNVQDVTLADVSDGLNEFAL